MSDSKAKSDRKNNKVSTIMNGHANGMDEEIEIQDANVLFFDNVVHHRKDSPFSDYKLKLDIDGFKNFINILLLLLAGSLIYENVHKYGVKANPIRWFEIIFYEENRLILFSNFIPLVFALFALFLERTFIFYLESMGRVTQENLPESSITFAPKSEGQLIYILKFSTNENEEKIFRAICLISMFSMMFVPIIVTKLNDYQHNYYLMAFVCLWYCFVFMKLYSFHEVNSWWRRSKVYDGHLKPTKRMNEELELYQGETLRAWDPTRLILYPDNLTISNILRFMLLQSFCYQCNLPLKRSRNYKFMLRCLIEIVILIELICILAQQWIVAPLEAKHFNLYEISFSKFLLVLFKMSIATITIFLIYFYVIFQSIMNFSAELFCFADRSFYYDWWNSRTISQFWQRWNLPIHRWLKRHMFKPLLYNGYSHFQATFLVFLFSGIFHEYFLSIPLGSLSVHFFFGMVSQIPLEMLTKNIRSWHMANAIVWFSLIIGQPLLILLYYSDYMASIDK